MTILDINKIDRVRRLEDQKEALEKHHHEAVGVLLNDIASMINSKIKCSIYTWWNWGDDTYMFEITTDDKEVENIKDLVDDLNSEIDKYFLPIDILVNNSRLRG